MRDIETPRCGALVQPRERAASEVAFGDFQGGELHVRHDDGDGDDDGAEEHGAACLEGVEFDGHGREERAERGA